MKYTVLALLLLLPAAAMSAEDCAKSSDACRGGARNLTPFLQAVAAAENGNAPATAKTPAEKPRAKRQAAAPAPAAPAAAPDPVEVSTAAPAAAPQGGYSSPLWLLFVGALLAGVYFYLSGGRRRGRRR